MCAVEGRLEATPNLPSRARHYAISISTPLLSAFTLQATARQLSRGSLVYQPSSKSGRLVGLSRFELLTPRLSSVCSNQLSYRPGLHATCLGCQRTRLRLRLRRAGPTGLPAEARRAKAGSLKTRQSAFHKNRSRSCYQIDLLESHLRPPSPFGFGVTTATISLERR